MRTYSAPLVPVRRLELLLRSNAYLARHTTEHDLIRRNARFREVHQGERCFILGNGPSLATEDLSLLRNDFVFTVNNLSTADVQGVTPRYHVVSDRRFFSLDPELIEDRAMLTTLRTILTGPEAPSSFVPSTEANFIRYHDLDASHTVNYFCNPFYFSDFYKITNDITRITPRFCSVVQHAVLIATFLGFTKVYLLGCDATNIVANINSALHRSTAEQYGYNVTRELDLWFERQFAKRSMERCAESYLEVLLGYRFLFEYCRAIGVDLVNCSSQSVIDSIPRRSLREVN